MLKPRLIVLLYDLTLKFHVWNTVAIVVLNWLCCNVYSINVVKRLPLGIMPHAWGKTPILHTE